MIVIDTNVISEMWKVEPHPDALTWFDAQAIETLYLSAITVAELRYGLAAMPEGSAARFISNDWSTRFCRPSLAASGLRPPRPSTTPI